MTGARPRPAHRRRQDFTGPPLPAPSRRDVQSGPVPRHAVFLVGVCALTFFIGLGRPALTDSDEAFYAESAREMLERGDWLTPYYNGEPRFDKPVLYYWLAAASYAVVGLSPGAARFPAALAGVGLVLVTFYCARRWYDEPTALLAGLIGATSAGIVAMARQALPDLPLAFFVTLSTWAALVALLDDPGRRFGPRGRRAWLLLAALAAAGAFLVKGPVGPALVALVVLPSAAIGRAGHGARHVTASDLGLAAAVFLVVALPWYGAMAAEHGSGYLERFFLAENFDRFASDRYNAPRAAWYYLPIIAGGMLPWSPFMILWGPALRRAWRRRTIDARALQLAVWASAPLAFYTLSVGKQPRYILPLLAPLAILLARAMMHALDDDRAAARRTFAACGAAAGVIVLLIGGLVYRARLLLVEWSPAVTLSVPAAILLAGGSIVALSLAATRHGVRARGIPGLVAAAAAVMAVGAHLVVLASPGPAPVERVAAMLAAARVADEPYGRHRVFDRNLVYYAGTPHVELPVRQAARDFLRSPGRVLCVLRAEDAALLRGDGLRLRRVGEVRYLNTGNLNLRTLLDPDPERYLQHVVLVANR